MKITSFNPLIVTKDAKSVIKLFEELGFEKRHTINATASGNPLTSVRMKDSNGFYVDISEVENSTLEHDLTLIRINVDDFDEAYKFLTEKGFKNTSGKTVETKTNKSAMMVSPTGFAFDLCQHIKDEK